MSELALVVILMASTIGLGSYWFSTAGSIVACILWFIAVPVFNSVTGRGNC